MKSRLMTPLILVCAILALSVTGYAQEATISGTVTDATGAVLPGVTVTAVLEASGNSFGAVTDARGDFRIPVRDWRVPAIHRVEMRLQQRVPIGAGRSIDGFAEVFNVFNRKNYGLYDTTETSPTYGQPLATPNLSYSPRTVQLGFHARF